MYWLSRKWWLLLLGLVALAAFIYGYTQVHLKVETEYAVVVDLILFILALTTIMGYGAYLLICRGIEDRVEHRLRENENALSARLHSSTGFVFWEHYRGGKPLEVAIARTRYALDCAKGLDEKRYEVLICKCKQNLAYYLAEAKESKDEAHILAKYAYERARDKKGRFKYETSYEWEETYAWVLWQFAEEDEVAREKARQIIASLISSADIPVKWRNEVKTDWDNLFLNQAKLAPNK